jgi:hypothetical protein
MKNTNVILNIATLALITFSTISCAKINSLFAKKPGINRKSLLEIELSNRYINGANFSDKQNISIIDCVAESYLRESQYRDAIGDQLNADYFAIQAQNVATLGVIAAPKPEQFGIIPSDVSVLSHARNALLAVSTKENITPGSENVIQLCQAYLSLSIWFVDLAQDSMQTAAVFRDATIQNVNALTQDETKKISQSNYNKCYSCRKIARGQTCVAVYFDNLSAKASTSFNDIMNRFVVKVKNSFENQKNMSISMVLYANHRNNKLSDARVNLISNKLISMGFSEEMLANKTVYSGLPENQQFITNNPYLENGIEVCVSK